jgi:crotonobetainyl-CoA:carnitine CoA-transferase CaiB-like acyl-CoA transferase
MPGALSHIRVIDLTSHLAGPMCTMLLADQGADVIKVERPGLGDEMRKSAPFINGMGASFLQINRNKRSVVLDLKTEEGREACRRLIDTADVFVENYKPGTAERLGLGYEALKARNPRLVYCAISGFGQTGPYRHRGGFDLMAQAMSGLMSVCGEVDGEPLRLPIPISDLTGGMYGCIGVLNALVARERTGKGQMVDVSLFESAISMGPYEAAYLFANGVKPPRIGQAHRNAAPYQIFPTKDGWLVLGAATQLLWEKFCKLANAPHLQSDPRFETNPKRVANHAALVPLVGEIMKRETTAHWLSLLEKEGIPAGPVLAHDQVLADPHVLSRGMVVDQNHPVAGPTKILGTPIKLSETPGGVRLPAPRLGEHTEALLAETSSGKRRALGD